MNSAEDALKAVEALTEIVAGWVADPDPDLRAVILRRLKVLRMGCEAIRLDKRGSEAARTILDRAQTG